MFDRVQWGEEGRLRSDFRKDNYILIVWYGGKKEEKEIVNP